MQTHLLVGLLFTLLATPPAGARENSASLELSGLTGFLKGGYQEARAEVEFGKLTRGDAPALQRLIALAKQGNSQAQNYIGVFLDRGQYGMAQNSVQAARYFNTANKGYPLAAYNLGLLYLLGRGVERSEEIAMAYMRQSVNKQRIPQAYVRIGLYHYRRKEIAEAGRWFREAAQENDPVGAYYVGRMLVEGKQDYREAMTWLDKAAGRRNADAARMIAYLYANGLGMDKTLELAAGWTLIHMALSQKGQDSNLPRISLFGLEEDRIQKARAFATMWLGSHPGGALPDYVGTLANLPR
ncbi:MAG: sel1 repeat family protein [Betaproteobacteria bacterium]|nr:sel1 repeat family protein [Betaproteobacteria bacterium]